MRDNDSATVPRTTAHPNLTQPGPTGGEALPAPFRLVRLAWLLAFLSTLTLEIAIGDGERSAAHILILVGIEGALVGLAHWWVTRRTKTPRVIHDADVTTILLVATGTFVCEVLLRSLWRTMLPLELLLLTQFRNCVLALAIYAHRPSCQKLCCLLATFLMIFASAVSNLLSLQGLVILFAIAGTVWLMEGYWSQLQGSFRQGRLTAVSERHLSRGWRLAIPALMAGVLLAVPITGSQTRAWRGFIPTSGGSDGYDANARSGVGNGDQLVAGTDNIQSFAPIDDAPFMTSHEPSLYDLFDDAYNEPQEVGNPDRAIPLTAQQNQNAAERQLSTSEKAGKQFSTLRKFGKPQTRHVEDLDSPALLYVKGRVPLHLKLEVFDRFDGVHWNAEDLPEFQLPLAMETLHDRPWLRLPVSHSLDVYSHPEQHSLQVIHLQTNRILAPTQLVGVHIDQLDRADFYRWVQPSIVRMDRDELPSLLTMHLQSRVVDRRRLNTARPMLTGGSPAYRQVRRDEYSAAIRELAQQWTRGLPHGWPQIAAITQRLQSEYRLDPQLRPPADCTNTAAHFLLTQRAGPDYQFASAATQLLRSLGYSVRLASGFYVRPERFDARSQQTAVLPEDVHVWLEVYAGAGDWITLDPTPGYTVLGPVPGWTEAALQRLRTVAGWMWQRRGSIAALTLLLGIVMTWRRQLGDAVRSAFWHWWAHRDLRQRVHQTVRLLESRCRLAGLQRQPGLTSGRWLATTCRPLDTTELQLLKRFCVLLDWAAYAPADLPAPVENGPELCTRVGRHWSLRRLRGQVPGPSCRPLHWHSTSHLLHQRLATGESLK